MGFPLIKFLFLGFFFLLALSFCRAKNVSVKVVGIMHCKDCIRNQLSSSQASLGINVVISCESRNRRIHTKGKGVVDGAGKFNVMLPAEISTLERCFAKLHTASSAAECPIKSSQTASVKLLSTELNASHDRPTIVKFAPGTCQSAFFWPYINFPPSPSFYGTFPQIPSPSPLTFHQTSPVPPTPILPPSSPNLKAPISKPPNDPQSPPIANNPYPPPQLPKPENSIPPPPDQPNYRNPIPIPRAPPVPQLPPIPTVPRKYFNEPKSEPNPPHSSNYPPRS